MIGKNQPEVLERVRKEAGKLVVEHRRWTGGDVCQAAVATADDCTAVPVERLHVLPSSITVLLIAGQAPEDEVAFGEFVSKRSTSFAELDNLRKRKSKLT